MRDNALQRILMTADTMGGVWTYAVELIRALEEHGVEVLLATMGAPVSKEQRLEISVFSNVQIVEGNYKLEWMDDPWRDIQASGNWLLELESSFAPDIIHLNGYAHGALPWSAPAIVAAHSCVLSWWRAVKGARAPAEWNQYENAVRAGLSAASLVIAPSEAMRDCLFDNYGLLPRTRVIPNGRSLDFFSPRPKEKFILSAGRLWDEAKNVRAVCACSSELPWPVCVAGETHHPNGSSSTGAGDVQNVRCLGKLAQGEMAGWLGRAAIYAAPAKYEPFGLSILEAALSGCALVLGDIPSLRENWNDAAIFVNPSDAVELGRQLRLLIENDPARTELGQLARERALRFDIRNTARSYREAYEAVLSLQSQEEVCAFP
jgi:glycogen(starch) synthase